MGYNTLYQSRKRARLFFALFPLQPKLERRYRPTVDANL
jgi:hypothetical protein